MGAVSGSRSSGSGGLRRYLARRRGIERRRGNREAYQLFREAGASHDPAELRELSTAEADVLRHLVSRNWVGAEAARAQLGGARYAGKSHPGDDLCFDIVVEGDVPLISRPRARYGPVTGVMVFDEEEPTGMIDLWVSHGLVSAVEYSWFTDEVPAAWPAPGQLREH